MFTITKTVEQSGVVVLGLDGSLNVEAVEQLESALQQVRLEDASKLVLDLSKLKYISSAGVGTFVACLAELKGKGGDVVFVNPSDEIREVFELLGFMKMFQVMDALKEAVDALATS